MPEIDQPFDVTKAVDFSDSQIAATWVDLPEGGFFQLVDPRSPMPLMLLGGKGSGRTHLMRYYSYTLQKIRAGGRALGEFLRGDGYIGIYMRCEGLNAGRFDGKGQPTEAWAAIFAYYMDLWLAQLVVQTLADAFSSDGALIATEATLVAEISGLFDEKVDAPEATLGGLVSLFTGLRREVDLAVNNAALSRHLGGLRIRATRGRLVFGVPQCFAKYLAVLQDLKITFLIDELENLTELQQQYVNTLIREKEAPCTFMVGARLYGFRTQLTLSAGEENRLGSEYEQVILDEQLRSLSQYDQFARQLVAKRLQGAGYDAVSSKDRLDSVFETYSSSDFERDQTRHVIDNYGNPRERPWIIKLNNQLAESIERGDAPGLSNVADVETIYNNLKCIEYPLLEKLNIFLLYQDWSADRNLLQASGEIAQGTHNLTLDQPAERHRHVLSHFKGDLMAQLLRETKQKQRYLGLQTFIDMSAGLPRHLFIVLKFIHRWAQFQGERPFRDTPISIGAQRAGVIQASSWFFEDARATGFDSELVRASIERLARFFHQLRYADKPVESSLTTFSFADSEVSEEVRRTIRQAQDTSLLLRIISGAKDRNAEGVEAKYQLNPMLCPRFDLPISRRGTVALSKDEMEAIFGQRPARFDAILAERLARMNAPFRRRGRGRSPEEAQKTLPGME